MTNKQIFNKVKKHLLTQGKKSYSRTMGSCMYLSGDGSKCAVGCLIKAKAYNPEMEMKPVRNKEVLEALRNSGIPTDEKVLELLNELRDIHDSSPPSKWEKQLEKLEDRYFKNDD